MAITKEMVTVVLAPLPGAEPWVYTPSPEVRSLILKQTSDRNNAVRQSARTLMYWRNRYGEDDGHDVYLMRRQRDFDTREWGDSL